MNKKICKFILFITIIFISFTVKANAINKIEMNVYLDKGGNAVVEETWDASLFQGTEGYRAFSKLGDRTITDFTVTDDEENKYESLTSWSTNRTFNEKSYKSGIHYTYDGLELCWGISKYGNRKYTLKYKINNLVTQYTDNQGIYFNFLNLNQEIGEVKITIHADFLLSLDNSRIWSFGNNGTINFDEGKIVMESSNGLSSSQYAVIMVRFNEEMFTLSTTSTKSFDDIYDEAFENVEEKNNSYVNNNSNIYSSTNSTIDNISKKFNNFVSDYSNKGFLGKILVIFAFIIAFIVIVLLLFLFVVFLPILMLIVLPFPMSLLFMALYGVFWWNIVGRIFKRSSFWSQSVPSKYTTKVKFQSNKKTPSYKKVNYYRDIPCNKDLYMMYWICQQYDIVDEKDLGKGIIGAIILKWIKEDKISVKKTEKSYEIVLDKEMKFESSIETELYNMMVLASSNNLILEKNEFKKWSKDNYKLIRDWLDDILRVGELNLKNNKYIVDNCALDSVKELAIQIKGFKRFLLEFSQISDRGSIEVKTWEEYLIFAELLGIAKKVRKELKELYPDINFDTINDVDFDFVDVFAEVCYQGMTSGYGIEYARTHYSSSDHDYGGFDSFSGGGGDSFSSGGDSSGGSSGGGFR